MIIGRATSLNDKAVKAAERRVAEVIRSAGDQREQAERELADAAATVEELDATLDLARGERDELDQAVEAAHRANHAQAIEIAQLNERLAAQARQLTAAQEQHQAEITAANERSERLATELEQTRQHGAEVVEGLRQEMANLKAQGAAAETSFAEQRKRMAAETHRCGEKLAAAQSAHDTALRETREAREALARQAGKLEALEAQNKSLVVAMQGGRKA